MPADALGRAPVQRLGQGPLGQPILFVRDAHGNTIGGAVNQTVAVDASHRLAVGLSGDSAADIDCFIDGDHVPAEVVTDQ